MKESLEVQKLHDQLEFLKEQVTENKKTRIKVEELEQNILILDKRTESFENKLTETYKKMFGNGEFGLVHKIDLLIEDISELKTTIEKLDKESRIFKYFVFVIIGLLMTKTPLIQGFVDSFFKLFNS